MTLILDDSLHAHYCDYKKDTPYILSWLVDASNSIIAAIPDGQRAVTDVINTTGKLTCCEIEKMAERVGATLRKRGEQTPSAILFLFHTNIKARQSFSEKLKAVYVEQGRYDEDFERDNKKHQHFIETLSSAFKILGRDRWLSARAGKSPVSEKETEDVVFANAFAALPVHESEDDPSETTISATVKVPLKEYHIIDGPDEKLERAFLAFSAFMEGSKLRLVLESYWDAVAYDRNNIAVAGAMSKMAIALVKTTATAVFVESDAKGKSSDSYITLLDGLSNGSTAKVGDTWFAMVRGNFGIHVYDALVEFVIDHQKNRNGSPTKRLRGYLNKWNPKCDLQQLSRDERLEWRRLYIINWLYELVNTFRYIVEREKPIDTAHLENVTWSIDGPYRRNARLFGIEDFASSVTTWAMQKPGTAFQHKILLHHVFQLQCLVDSFTTTLGWFPDREGDGEFEPRPADFRTTQAIDRFLDRHTDDRVFGFVKGVNKFLETVKGMPSRSKISHMDNLLDELQYLRTHFETWLGTSEHIFDTGNKLKSRFEQVKGDLKGSRNGLWEYSPFLCGAGLAEALNIAHRIGLILHDILASKKHLSQHLGRFNDLYSMFDSRAFSKAFIDRARKSKRSSRITQPRARVLARSATNLAGWLNLDENAILSSKSSVLVLQEHDWKFLRVPEDKLIPDTALGRLHLIRAKRTVDPATGKIRFEDTVLVKKARKHKGIPDDDDAALLDPAGNWVNAILSNFRSNPVFQSPMASLGHKDISTAGQDFELPTDPENALSTMAVWFLLQTDIRDDICSRVPPCGFNYLRLATTMLKTWTQIDDCLEKLQTPLSSAIKDVRHGLSRRDKLLRELCLGSSEDHKLCADKIAETLQQNREFKSNCTYWDGYYCSACEAKHDTDEKCKDGME